jgi:hypothetical protein
MDYKGIPDEILDLALGEDYDSTWTLRTELSRVHEDLIAVDWQPRNDFYPSIMYFVAWTQNYVLCLVDTSFGDRVIISLPRNPKGEPNG